MAVKEVRFSDDARARMFKGANVLANAVKATLGPKGRNAVLEKSYGAPTITKDGDSIGDPEDLVEAVCHVDYSDAARSQPSEDVEQARDVGLRQCGAGFVEHEKIAFHRHGAGDRDNGFLRGGKVAHPGIHIHPAAHALDRRGRGRTRGRPGDQSARSWIARDHGYVLCDRHRVDQPEILVDESDWKLVDERIDNASVDSNFTIVRPVHSGQDLDQGRFAGSILAEQRMHLTGFDIEVDFVESDVAGEALRQPSHLEQCGEFAVHGAHLGAQKSEEADIRD